MSHLFLSTDLCWILTEYGLKIEISKPNFPRANISLSIRSMCCGWHNDDWLGILEFHPNEFHWIQGIMTKSKNSNITSIITHLVTNTFPAIVIDSKFSLMSLAGIYCHKSHWIDTYPDVEITIPFLPLYFEIYMYPLLNTDWPW